MGIETPDNPDFQEIKKDIHPENVLDTMEKKAQEQKQQNEPQQPDK